MIDCTAEATPNSRQHHRLTLASKRMARLMQEAGLRGVCRRKWATTILRSEKDRESLT